MTPESPITVVLAPSFIDVDRWLRTQPLGCERVVAITQPDHVHRVLALQGFNVVNLGSPWATRHDLDLIESRAKLR